MVLREPVWLTASRLRSFTLGTPENVMTFRAAALLSLTALAVPVLAQGAPVDASAREVLARARAAQGGDAWEGIRAIWYTGTIASGGLEGRLDSVVDVPAGRFRDVWQLGP